MQINPNGPLKVLVLHGPNLNLLGLREPDIYGAQSFDDINRKIQNHAKQIGVDVKITQSNHEGALIDALHDAIGWAEAVVINAGAYTHYSYAIADAIRAIRLPVVEVHLTNVHAREEWRRHSVIAPAVVGQISGFGVDSYLLALDAARALVRQGKN